MSTLAKLQDHPAPWDFPQALPLGASEEIGDMIEALRAYLDMDLAFVARQIGTTHRIFTHVSARDVAPMSAGDIDTNDNSLCWLVIEGKLPERVFDINLYEVACHLPIAKAFNVRGHFSVPLRRRDGSVLGSLCFISYRPRPDIDEKAVRMLRSIAAIVSDQIENCIEHRERSEEAEQEINRLIAEDDLIIIHQPIFDLNDWYLIGHECLMRQKAIPDRSPLELLDCARLAGKTVDLELHAVAKALATIDPAHPERFVAINVSTGTLTSDRLADLLPDGLASRLVIELNGTDPAPHYGVIKQAVESLKLSAWIAINSVGPGVGISGLRSMVELAPDIIKIDGELLLGLGVDPARRALVKSLVQFAEEMGVSLIAQGVETREDLMALRDLGVRFAQGFVFGRPGRPVYGTRVW